MKLFLKSFWFILLITLFFNLYSTYSFGKPSFFVANIQTIIIQEEPILLNNKQPISDQTINEIKKSQILILIIVTFFVTGFLFLIYHLKKVRIINQQLEDYSKENEFLISETNHRVNNNLQLISLLISDTIRKKHHNEDKSDFVKLLSKVETIASLHRHLYKTKTKNTIDLQHYLAEIKNNFSEIEEENDLEIIFDIDSIQIHSDNAMYIGLLVTELIINSVKYAFEKNQKKSIILKIINKNELIVFHYNDNGINSKHKEISPKLVLQLCQQLKVDPIIETTNGFHLFFNF